jgi:import inner membrane translocase subunit TIM50
MQSVDVKATASGAAKKPLIKTRTAVALAGLGITGLAIYDIRENREGVLGRIYWGSSVEAFLSNIYDQLMGNFQDALLPSSDALLPEWPTDPYYANVPPGVPVPPLLVLDLEKTAIGSEYDARYGWRHVKRPGLDNFIQQLSSYYEIVIFSENDLGAQQDLLMAIDKENRCFKLGSNAAELRNNVYLKRLDYMNRDIRKIVLIDDSSAASSLFPRNTLLVKPYEDIRDKTDRELDDLIPLLQALVHEQVDDFRDVFDSLGTHEASEAATEYFMRVSKRRREQEAARKNGLGGLARDIFATKMSEAPVVPRSSVVSSAMDIVGSDGSEDGDMPRLLRPTSKTEEGKGGGLEFKGQIKTEIGSNAAKQKGGLFKILESKEKEIQEHEMYKREKMNEIYLKRMAEEQGKK